MHLVLLLRQRSELEVELRQATVERSKSLRREGPCSLDHLVASDQHRLGPLQLLLERQDSAPSALALPDCTLRV